ncbi:hypothetical protein LNP17_21125 [Klebsiella variicola subsp. variicola]|nr:hypothetical protein [Klebsiella variicola subsp. variicola]
MTIASIRPVIRARSRWAGRELLGEDSDKDQVIDAQHQFDNHQRDETCPD